MALGFQRQGIFGRKPMFPRDDILSNDPYGTPGFGDSLMQRQAEMEPMNTNSNAMPIGVKEMTKKPGFFQKGGFGQYALAALSDLGARLNGNEPNMLQNVMSFKMQEEDARLRQQLAQQQRMQAREDKMWEWQNKPKDARYNDTIEDFKWYQGLNDEERKLYHQMNPVVGYMADGTPRVINPYEAQQPNLDSQPASEDGYDYIPGPGGRANPSNWKKAGGQSGAPTGGFR